MPSRISGTDLRKERKKKNMHDCRSALLWRHDGTNQVTANTKVNRKMAEQDIFRRTFSGLDSSTVKERLTIFGVLHLPARTQDLHSQTLYMGHEIRTTGGQKCERFWMKSTKYRVKK